MTDKQCQHSIKQHSKTMIPPSFSRSLFFILWMLSPTLSQQVGRQKFFKQVHSLDGVSTPCASDKPACSFKVRAGRLDTSASGVECAQRCTTDVDCVYFNYKSDVGLCELYDWTPRNCSNQSGCSLFVVTMC